MRARLIGLAAAIGAAVVLCAGCQGMSGSSPAPDSGDPGQLGAELTQIQSTLDSVSAQINADSAP